MINPIRLPLMSNFPGPSPVRIVVGPKTCVVVSEIGIISLTTAEHLGERVDEKVPLGPVSTCCIAFASTELDRCGYRCFHGEPTCVGHVLLNEENQLATNAVRFAGRRCLDPRPASALSEASWRFK